MRRVLIAVLSIVFILIVIFVVLFFAFRIGVAYSAHDTEAPWDAFNTSLVVLELYIVIFTIGIGLLGFFGYQGIVKAAENIAKKGVDEKMSSVLKVVRRDVGKQVDDILAGIPEKIDAEIKVSLENIDIKKLLSEGT